MSSSSPLIRGLMTKEFTERLTAHVRRATEAAAAASRRMLSSRGGRRIAFLDCEASSVDEHHSYPIEVGWCFAESCKAESHLILPHPDWLDWDPQSQELHGLSRKILFEKGEPGPLVARRLIALLADAVVYSDSD